jgi:hypothetical protein
MAFQVTAFWDGAILLNTLQAPSMLPHFAYISNEQHPYCHRRAACIRVILTATLHAKFLSCINGCCISISSRVHLASSYSSTSGVRKLKPWMGSTLQTIQCGCSWSYWHVWSNQTTFATFVRESNYLDLTTFGRTPWTSSSSFNTNWSNCFHLLCKHTRLKSFFVAIMEKLLPTTSLYDFNSDFGHLGFRKSESWNIFLASSNICIRDISNLFVLHPQFGFIHQQLLQ